MCIYIAGALFDFLSIFYSAVDTPDGFLHEWWVIFHDMFRSQTGFIEKRGMGSTVAVMIFSVCWFGSVI